MNPIEILSKLLHDNYGLRDIIILDTADFFDVLHAGEYDEYADRPLDHLEDYENEAACKAAQKVFEAEEEIEGDLLSTLFSHAPVMARTLAEIWLKQRGFIDHIRNMQGTSKNLDDRIENEIARFFLLGELIINSLDLYENEVIDENLAEDEKWAALEAVLKQILEVKS